MWIEKCPQRRRLFNFEKVGLPGDGEEFVNEQLVRTEAGVFVGALDVKNDEAGVAPVALTTHNSAHPLNHLTALFGGGHDDRQVGIRHVDALFQGLHRGQHPGVTTCEGGHDFLALVSGELGVVGRDTKPTGCELVGNVISRGD